MSYFATLLEETTKINQGVFVIKVKRKSPDDKKKCQELELMILSLTQDKILQGKCGMLLLHQTAMYFIGMQDGISNGHRD